MGRMDHCQGDKAHRKEQELLTVGSWEHLRKNAELYWHFCRTQLQKEVKTSHGVTNHLEKSGKATLNILIIALPTSTFSPPLSERTLDGNP